MVTNRPKSARQTVEDDVLATAHQLATALHRGGAMDDVTMRDMDRLCLPPRPDYAGPDVQRIRAATHMSQPVFARLLGVNKSAVAQWERGAKRPSGPALRLLEMLDPSKPESPIVLVRREMAQSGV
jgi:putative transcriptional regulator